MLMRKLLLALIASVLSVAAKADHTVVLDFMDWNFPGADQWQSSYAEHTVSYDEATVLFTKANKQTAGNTIDNCPVTKGNDIVVTASAEIVSTSIVLKQWGSKEQTATLTVDNVDVASTDAFLFSEVAVGAMGYTIRFSSQSNQVGIQSITLVLKGDGPVVDDVQTPVISPVTGTYSGPQTVSITAGGGCAIYYTLDGSMPNDACTLYDAPFEVSQTTTVKAVAYNDEDVASRVATSVITILQSIGNTADHPYTTAEAIALIDNPSSNLADTVYVEGVVSNIEGVNAKYKSLTYWLDNKTFEVYSGYGLNRDSIESEDYLGVGDTVVVCGTIKKYGSTYEFNNSNYIVSLRKASTPAVSIRNTPETAYSVARAIELVDAGQDLDTKVYVRGIISSIKEVDTGSYGNATYFISDDGQTQNEFEVYRGYSVGGNKFTSETEIKVGDVVVVYGKIMKFYEVYEFASGNYIYSLNGSTSAIKAVKTEPESPAIDPMTDAVFNICGQRVYDISKKGIYIVNGKKYIVR